ncbi:hypothetical protein COP2_046290 [Malus domestica]
MIRGRILTLLQGWSNRWVAWVLSFRVSVCDDAYKLQIVGAKEGASCDTVWNPSQTWLLALAFPASQPLNRPLSLYK